MNSFQTYQSFTYTLNSGQGTGTLCNDLIFDFGGFSENYDTYIVQCIAFSITPTTLVSPSGFYHLIVDDLAENGYFSGLKSNQAILATLSTSINVGTLTSGEGSIFIVKNMRSQRQLRFQLFGPDLLKVPNTQVPTGTYWTASLLFTPII